MRKYRQGNTLGCIPQNKTSGESLQSWAEWPEYLGEADVQTKEKESRTPQYRVVN